MLHVHCQYAPQPAWTGTTVDTANSTTCLAAMSLYACHQPHDGVAGYCTRLKFPTSPPSAPKETMVRRGSPKMLTSGGVSALEHLPFVTPFNRSLPTECRLMATLHLSQPSAPSASLCQLPQEDPASADVAPQTPLTAPTQTNSGCVELMLMPSGKLPAVTILRSKAIWLHWTLAGAPFSQQLSMIHMETASSTCRTLIQIPWTSTSVSAGVTRGGTTSVAAMRAKQRANTGCKRLRLFRRPCLAPPPPRQHPHRPSGNTSSTVYSMQMQCCLISSNHAIAS